MMRCFQTGWAVLILWLGGGVCFQTAGGMAAPFYPDAGSAAGVATAGISLRASPPRPLVDFWLRFHEVEICQDIDAVFVFHDNGMEVWCQVEDERSYQKLAEMVLPLQASFQIDIYATRPAAKKKQPEDKDPPPSLWNNAELLGYLKDPAGWGRDDAMALPGGDDRLRRNDTLKQRLFLYAAQLQDWRRRLMRYGADVPALAQAGFGEGYASDTKLRAAGICLAHLQALDKYAGRLADSLAEALPKHAKQVDEAAKAPRSRAKGTPAEIALQLSTGSRVLSSRVYAFLRPQQHTVQIGDLREPSLLESLRSLRELVSDFQKAAAQLK
jgi:hypothetical protein